MKILQVMTHASAHGFAGGAQKVFVELGNNLAKRGHEIVSVYNDTTPGKLFFDAASGVKIVNLSTPSQGRGHKGWKVLREIIKPLTKSHIGHFFPNPVHLESIRLLAKPLKRLIADTQPDVILAYGVREHHCVETATKHSVNRHIPVIHMIHSEVYSYFQGLSYTDKHRLNNCAAVQALTPDFAEEFSALIGREVVAIPNIVTPPTEFAHLDVPKERKRIMMHSRLDKKKQQHVLLEAFALLKDNFPDWDLVIFGGGKSQGYIKKLHDIVVLNNMSEQVSICEPTSNALKELCCSDIFAFPSIHEEGWGLVLTEAMSVGLPCLGIEATPAINFLITSESAGLVSSNNVHDFAKQLRILMSNPQLRIEYGHNAKLGMKKYYADNVCDQWESLFDEVIAR